LDLLDQSVLKIQTKKKNEKIKTEQNKPEICIETNRGEKNP